MGLLKQWYKSAHNLKISLYKKTYCVHIVFFFFFTFVSF